MPTMNKNKITFDLITDCAVSGKNDVPPFLKQFFVPWSKDSGGNVEKLNAEYIELMGKLYKNKIIAVDRFSILDIDLFSSNIEKWKYPIIIHGDRGTGKELIARYLYKSGRRKDMPFVAVNCAAIPEPLFEAEMFGCIKGAGSNVSSRDGYLKSANGGVLFLDEIHHLSPYAQAALLRALDANEIRPVGSTSKKATKVDVQLYSATNVPLEMLTEKRKKGGYDFLPDLFDRINGPTISLRPLHLRHDNEKKALVSHFIFAEMVKQKTKKMAFPKEVFDSLWNPGTPYAGNIRELQTRTKYAVHLYLDVYRDATEYVKGELDRILSPATKRFKKFKQDLTTGTSGEPSLGSAIEFMRTQSPAPKMHSDWWTAASWPVTPAISPFSPPPAQQSNVLEAARAAARGMPEKSSVSFDDTLLEKDLPDAKKEAVQLFHHAFLDYQKKKYPGITQKELAKMLGVSESTLSRMK